MCIRDRPSGKVGKGSYQNLALLYKKGELNNALAFESRVKEICDELNIKFNGSQLNKLSNLENSHFTIDGHFTASANAVVGMRLAEFISGLQNVK